MLQNIFPSVRAFKTNASDCQVLWVSRRHLPPSLCIFQCSSLLLVCLQNYKAISCSSGCFWKKVFQHFLDLSSYLTLLSHELKESGCAKHTNLLCRAVFTISTKQYSICNTICKLFIDVATTYYQGKGWQCCTVCDKDWSLCQQKSRMLNNSRVNVVLCIWR